MVDAAAVPVRRRSRGSRVAGAVAVFVVLALAVWAAVAVAGWLFSAGKPVLNASTSGSVAQLDCHDLVAARLGTGLAYSSEQVVADHNGKGPGLLASGMVAQSGSRYAFVCSATAVPGGDVKGVKLESFGAN